MRPNPRQGSESHQPDRIIYLGDVRRRRGVRRQAPDRAYIAAIALAGLLSWALWLTVVFTLQPARLLTYLAFFLPLSLALTATASLTGYAVEWARAPVPDLARCLRRGVLVAAVVVVNLAFVAAHRWTPVAGIVSLAAAAALDFAAGRRSIR